MKNIDAGVGALPTREKKQEAEVKKVVEEEAKYIRKENEMIFCLEEAPEYQISAVAEWAENSRGDIVGEPDTYFLHITTGQRCESVRDCFDGWSEPDEESTEKWETLCSRIEETDGLEQIMCDEESFGV